MFDIIIKKSEFEFNIPEQNVSTFFEKLKSLQSKLSKHDLVVDIEKNGSYVLKSKNKDGEEYDTTIFKFKVSGDTYYIDGYDHLANIVKKEGFFEVIFAGENYEPKHSQNVSENFKCAKCNTVRKRSGIALFKNISSGEIVHVGKECAKDFFDKNMINRFLFTSTLSKFREEENLEERSDLGLRPKKITVPLEYCLELSFKIYREHGFKGSGEKDSNRNKIIEAIWKKERPSSIDKEYCSSLLQNKENFLSKLNGSMRANVESCLKNDMATEDMISYIAFVPMIYLKEPEIKTPKSKKYLGNPGDTFTCEITIKDRYSKPSNYHRGDDYYIEAIGPEGELLLMPAGSFFPEKGERIVVTGKIKSCFTNKADEMITYLNRVKVSSCSKTMLFIKDICSAIDGKEINDQAEYDDFYYDLQSIYNKHNIASISLELNNFEKFISSGEIFNCDKLSNKSTSFEFSLSKFVKTKITESNGVYKISFQIV